MTDTKLLIGETMTGRITDTVDVTDLGWEDVLNKAGSIDVTVPEDVIRSFGPGILRQKTHCWRSFLAVEEDGRIKQAGPILSRPRSWETGQVRLGASGIWRWLDTRIVRGPGARVSVVGSDVSYGGLAVGLVRNVITSVFSGVPIVLPADEPGTRTETWYWWQFATVGEELRQLTQRATTAPDIRFQPRRRSDDPRFLEWVMEVGTEAVPALGQTGQDWVFDATVDESPVVGITPDEDGNEMAQQVVATGTGMEEDLLFAYAYDTTLLNLGWPLTEASESHHTVEEQATLTAHAIAAVRRRARPIEVYKVTVRDEAAREVKPGDYCRVVTKAPEQRPDGSWSDGDAWLGAVDKTMRVQSISGGLDGVKVLTMFSMQADL